MKRKYCSMQLERSCEKSRIMNCRHQKMDTPCIHSILSCEHALERSSGILHIRETIFAYKVRKKSCERIEGTGREQLDISESRIVVEYARSTQDVPLFSVYVIKHLYKLR